MKQVVRFFLMTILIGIVPSCKKDNNQPVDDFGPENCKIVGVSTLYPSNAKYYFDIHYDEAGRLLTAKDRFSASLDSYFYSGNRIVIVYSDPVNSSYYSDTIFVNNENHMERMTYGTYGTGERGYYVYHYGIDDYPQYREKVPNGGVGTISNYYVWQNGDLIKDSIPASNEKIYEYDTTKSSQTAAEFDFYLMTAGTWPKSRHLYIGYKSHPLWSPSFTYDKKSYSFDQFGKILSDTTSLQGIISTYEYKCN